MPASLADQIRQNLNHNLSSLYGEESVLTAKINRLHALLAKIDQHLSSFVDNRNKFHSLYNPQNEWDGAHRRIFDNRLNSETLADYQFYITSVHHLREDVQDQIGHLNGSLNLCRSDITSIHSSLAALKTK
ncbi:DUF5082 family protein [Sporolactobacillus sp. CQH2019]|uniref:YwqH-like family protein n=1 Tax=Sporolactobacillus sp. CQH2019 TaxID=3023512 RepID=UPI002367D50D|nr:DUF5082 family protein [Sporolactobacillus sp. CQH2019]MDD9149879.1 DUF5082 family protein [Sporolactobacillus sp. CQH2019]